MKAFNNHSTDKYCSMPHSFHCSTLRTLRKIWCLQIYFIFCALTLMYRHLLTTFTRILQSIQMASERMVRLYCTWFIFQLFHFQHMLTVPGYPFCNENSINVYPRKSLCHLGDIFAIVYDFVGCFFVRVFIFSSNILCHNIQFIFFCITTTIQWCCMGIFNLVSGHQWQIVFLAIH